MRSVVKLQKASNIAGTSSSMTPRDEAKKQLSLHESLSRHQKWSDNDPRTIELDRAIGAMIALDDLPFTHVEGLGFRSMMRKARSQYKLKKRSFYTRLLCNDLYEETRQSVAMELRTIGKLSFTTDVWSQPAACVSLLGLTAHGINASFERINLVLASSEIKDKHTGQNISDKLNEMLTGWEIPNEQVHIFMRDAGANMRRATALAGVKNEDCTVHQVQLVVEAGLREQRAVIDICARCRTVAGHFHHSITAQEALHAIQGRLNQKVLSTKQTNNTRWNTTLYMLERMLEIKESITLYATQTGKVPLFSADDWDIIQKLVSTLKPFEELTRKLSDLQSSMSDVIPLILALVKLCAQRDDGTDSGLKSMRNKLSSELNRRFDKLLNFNDDDPSTFVYAISTFLDPRYKSKLFPTEKMDFVRGQLIKQCVGECEFETPEPPAKQRKIEEDTGTTQIESRTLSQSLNAALCDTSTSSEEGPAERPASSDVAKMQIVRKSVESYENAKRAKEGCPLQWWKANQHTYPQLAQLALTYLGCPPSSVPSEQLFSGAGLIYTPHRSRLHGSKAEKLLFLKYSLPRNMAAVFAEAGQGESDDDDDDDKDDDYEKDDDDDEAVQSG